MNYVDRPAFSEGQVLSASDLQLTVDYARGSLEKHDAVAHTAGVVDGLAIVLLPQLPPATGKAAFVAPGLAIDKTGRQITIATQMPVVTDPIAGLPTGPYPVFVWRSEAALTPATAADPCRTVTDRVRESANVGVFADAPTAAAQQPSAICLGYVQWDATQKALVPYAGAVNPRQGSGVRAHEIVAPEHTVAVHGEDNAATTFSVQGTAKAVATADGTPPALQVPGGSLQFAPADPPASGSTISLAYAATVATGNELVIDLGNDDPHSAVVIESHSKTVLASIDGTGTLTVAGGKFANVTALGSVVVGSGDNTLSLQSVPPAGAVGVSASHTLPLLFGTAATDVAMIVSGATPAVTIDKHALTVNEKSVAVGTLDAAAGTAGLATTAGDPLVLRAANNDVILAPNNTPLLRFTADGHVLNMAAGACDVTPYTDVAGTQFLFRLGPIAVAYGMASATLHPIADAPAAVTFPQAFAIVPAFFVNAYTADKFTVTASPTGVTTTGATYKVVRFNPLDPADGDGTSFSNASTAVKISWVAFGVMG